LSDAAFLHYSATHPFQLSDKSIGSYWKKTLSIEPLAKLLKARGSRHSGQAKRDPESSIFEHFWILAPAPDPDPGFAGMTE
jgi:hypothetical protein